MKRDDSSPEAYRDDVEGRLRTVLEEVRGLIFRAVPEVEEGIRYGMLDYPGLANLAAQKGYVALYVSATILAKHKGDFANLDCGKSCLRFRRVEQIDRKAVISLLRDVRAFRASG